MVGFHASRFDDQLRSNVGSFVTNLPETLGAMFVDPRCVVAIVEFADGRYVQFWADPSDLLICEVVSNERLGQGEVLSSGDEKRLREAGWLEPGATSSPNWRYDIRDFAGLARGVTMLRDVVTEVFAQRSANPVFVRSWIHQSTVATSDDTRWGHWRHQPVDSPMMGREGWRQSNG